MKSKTLNKLLKTVFLLSPLLASAGFINGVVESAVQASKDPVGRAGSGSRIGPIYEDNVQLIYSSTWDDPSLWSDPGPEHMGTKARDRFYRLYFSPASAKYMYDHFWEWGWYDYVVGNRTSGSGGPMWSMSSNFYYLLRDYAGLGRGSGDWFGTGHDDADEFWQMTHNWNNFDDWYVGTTDTYKDSPNIRFDKYNEGDWHQILDNAVNFNTGAWMFIYVEYIFLAANNYGVGYGYA